MEYAQVTSSYMFSYLASSYVLCKGSVASPKLFVLNRRRLVLAFNHFDLVFNCSNLSAVTYSTSARSSYSLPTSCRCYA